MKLNALIIAVLSLFIFTAPAAHAQQDIGGIIDEIFKGGQFPKPGEEERRDRQSDRQGRIDNIPVEIRFETSEYGLPAEAMLIVSAYAPPPPNVRRSAPLMLGQTRLLMSGLTSPTQIIIAAPSSITQDLDHARIEAKIVDVNGTIIYELPFPGKYEGYEAPVLNLEPVGEFAANMPPPTKPISNSGSLSSETVRGTVKLNGKAPKFAGSNLVVRLVEDGLAGGTSNMIAGETRQILDGKRTPFEFELERVMDSTRADTPLALEVWIEDWAGRKTHVTPAPIPYNSPDTKYRIRLDAIGPLPYNPLPRNTIPRPVTPKPATPKPVVKPKPIPKPVIRPKPVVRPTLPVNTKQIINGEARFNADKGLPKGAVLIAVLERTDHTSRPTTLASTRVFLDGLSGDVAFKLTANSFDIDPSLPTPVLRVRIESKDGTLFFSNPGGTRLAQGFNAVNLRKSPNY